jgi:hypothetical protein
MAQKPKSLPTTPTALCGEQLVSLMIGHLVTRLEVEAGKNNGVLAAQNIRDTCDKFLAEELPRFQSTFQRNYDECTQHREEHRWAGIRKQPFDRILTKRFAHLFPARKGDDGGQGLLSRRVIPGFNLAINKMIGPMLYEQCQRKTRAIMDRHPTEQGGYDWGKIYADPDCLALTNDVLVVVAHYFSEFERRRTWFMELVNSNLARPTDDEELHANWQLTPHGFSEMMRTLFEDMESTMTKHPERLKARYGEQTIRVLNEFLARLKIEL